MSSENNLPLAGLSLKPCQHLICWSVPFSMLLSTPFALVFSYYNTQGQKNFKLWSVKLLGKDLLLFAGIFSVYAFIRTLALDPYCDPKSIHYDTTKSAFERKKLAVESMRKALESEGKSTHTNKE